MNIKLNFSISELINSDVALKNKMSNMPDISALDNILNLIFYCLQPLRDKLNKPMIITSGYRSSRLNSMVKGKINSQHLFGQAADFYVKNMSVSEVINFIKKSEIEYDQLINEYDKWVHISFVKNNNRKQFFRY